MDGKKISKGLIEQLKDPDFIKLNKSISLKEMEKFLLNLMKESQKKRGNWELRKLSYIEAGFNSEEEYEQTTGLYKVGNSITGLGGWNIVMEELQRMAKQNLK